MTKAIFLLFAFASALGAAAQVPPWAWAKAARGTGYDRGNGICVDNVGNVLVVGDFSSPVMTFGDTTLVNYAGETNDEFFVAKYDPEGNVLWLRQGTGPGAQDGTSVATDEAGNVFVGGYFTDTLFLDTLTFYASAFCNCFLAKYDPDGTLLWATSAGGSYSDLVMDLATDATGHLLATGYFDSFSITFGGETLVNSHAGTADIFVVRFNNDGQALWISGADGDMSDWAQGIAVDDLGRVVVTGYYDSEPFTFGSTTLINSGVNGDQTHDIFVAKYNTNGNAIWAKHAGYNHQELAWDVAVDGNNEILIVGEFAGDNIGFGDTLLLNSTTNLNSDMFLAKYSSGGVPIWAASGGGNGFERALGLAVDDYNNVVVTGVTESPAGYFSGLPFQTDSTGDLFAAKYSSEGVISWVTTAGGDREDMGTAVAIDQAGAIVFTGYFADTVTLGPYELPGTTDFDIWVMKMDASTTGLAEPPADGVALYPVPSSGRVTITSPEPMRQVLVRDATGRIVYRANPKSQQAQLELHIPGVYMAEITIGNTTTTQRLVIGD